MEINTILIVGNILISAMATCQKSRCSEIEISDCLKIRREVPEQDPEEVSMQQPPMYT